MYLWGGQHKIADLANYPNQETEEIGIALSNMTESTTLRKFYERAIFL